MTATAISNNHSSHDQQIADVMAFLALRHPAVFTAILTLFPEWIGVQWDGSWVDTDKMGVDPEWAMWLTDAIEETGLVQWSDGEPWLVERTVR